MQALERWVESERRLNVLRTLGGKIQKPTEEEIARWICAASKT